MSKPSTSRSTLVVPKHVLVVEDDAILTMSIEQILLDAGVITVSTCATTERAVEILQSTIPDALVLDVHLADRDDGYSIAELIAALGPRKCKIAFSTGTPDDIPPRIAKLGTVLTKPYRPEQLIESISHKPKGIRGLMR